MKLWIARELNYRQNLRTIWKSIVNKICHWKEFFFYFEKDTLTFSIEKSSIFEMNCCNLCNSDRVSIFIQMFFIVSIKCSCTSSYEASFWFQLKKWCKEQIKRRSFTFNYSFSITIISLISIKCQWQILIKFVFSSFVSNFDEYWFELQSMIFLLLQWNYQKKYDSQLYDFVISQVSFVIKDYDQIKEKRKSQQWFKKVTQLQTDFADIFVQNS